MVLKIEKKLVLASASPSRKMLLEQAGLAFEVKVSGVDEAVPEDFTPAQTVECLAQRKGRAVLALCGDAAVIAADSVVSLDERIIGKPKDDEDAKATLRALSGRTHQLYTGVCLLADGKEEVFHQVTDVTFYPLTEEEIAAYVALGDPGAGPAPTASRASAWCWCAPSPGTTPTSWACRWRRPSAGWTPCSTGKAFLSHPGSPA